MRTTIDLRDDLHERARSIARDRRQSLSETINDLLGRVLDGSDHTTELIRSEPAGITTVRLGRVITDDDVRALDDE